ncbi:hypothetical protein OVA06_09520 [Pseudarthrobacter sp. SL88]|uniref:hypothetical protein n=1 Tax=Pseudarthrobacter sp. SL88 TaxID=2994666 RepID=UPI0022764E42|nr:hypothetical protein [Pseudarthrobacter sp. SL88]MCY1674944.1 hypothetical protein [Pseudarthrobacter sp. SL88]
MSPRSRPSSHVRPNAAPLSPSAALALNLGISTGVLLARIDNQRKLAYIAFDETELSAGMHISAVVRDPEEVGRQAALLARVTEPNDPARTVTLPSRLIKRGSGEIPHQETSAVGRSGMRPRPASVTG